MSFFHPQGIEIAENINQSYAIEKHPLRPHQREAVWQTIQHLRAVEGAPIGLSQVTEDEGQKNS